MLAIRFLSYTTVRASLRGIFFRDDFNLYAKQRGLVFNHCPEPVIWPDVQALIHPFAIGDVLSDAGQVSQDDGAYTLLAHTSTNRLLAIWRACVICRDSFRAIWR